MENLFIPLSYVFFSCFFSMHRPGPENEVSAELRLLFSSVAEQDELPAADEVVATLQEAAQNGTFNISLVRGSITVLGKETFRTSIYAFCPSGCLLGDRAPTHANFLSSLTQRPQVQHLVT